MEAVGYSIGRSGLGIPEAVPREIIDPVFTTKKAGKTISNGLGVVRGITTLGRPPHFVSKCG
jgi:C4-dicarboxylate-specific signal transduction histidine kinase